MQLNFDEIVLNHGVHDSAEDGHCLLEVVSMFADEDFSDSPACVDPVLASFGRSWNDGMRSNDERAQLRQYITRLPGTANGSDLSQKRGWMAADWFIRVHTVAWLALTPALAHHAEAIKAQPQITCLADLERVQPLLNAAKKDAEAAWYAARAAARDAAGAAAWYAAEAAAWYAARDAAGDAARAAAGKGLETTVKKLQESAHELFSAMIDAV